MFAHGVQAVERYVALGALGVVGGCIAPVAATQNRAMLGIYVVESAQLSSTVRYDRITGIGVSIGRSGAGLGYCDLRTVTADMDELGCDVVTPLGEIATGLAADTAARRLGAEWEGGRQK